MQGRKASAAAGEVALQRGPQVSVVIPVHNRTALLDAAIASVAVQSLAVTEILVVDDGSDEDVAATLARSHPGIRVLRLPFRQGAARARNAGIAAARGDYIAFLDSDDLFEPGKLSAQLALMQAEGAGFATAASWTAEGKVSMGRAPDAAMLRRRNCRGGTSGLIAEAALLRACSFDPQMRAAQDWELFLRLEKRARGSHCTEPLWRYGADRGDRITRNKTARLLGHAQLYRRHIRDAPEASAMDRRIHRLTIAMLAADRQGRRLCRILLQAALKLALRLP